MKKKVKFEISADKELCRKAVAASEREGLSFNNYIIKLMRSSIAYHERVHGRMDVSGTELSEEIFSDEE